MSRQAGMEVLNDLPYARQEAEYVSKLTGGNSLKTVKLKNQFIKKNPVNMI